MKEKKRELWCGVCERPYFPGRSRKISQVGNIEAVSQRMETSQPCEGVGGGGREVLGQRSRVYGPH